MNELVSIITPTYNSEQFIAEAIKSVQNQSYSHWEIIIVDDCSKDKTVNIIQNFIDEDHRIYLIQLDKNSGAGVARNNAINNAKGRYIAFLDSDDLWKPDKLSKQIKFMQRYNIPFTFSFYDCINEKGDLLNKRIEAPKKLSYYQLFFCNFVGNLTGIYDSNYFGKMAISSIRKRQDWIVWLTILKKIKTAKPVPESLALYRIRENSISASKVSLLKDNYAIYRKFHHLNIIVSLACMLGFLFTQLLVKPKFVKIIKT
ncbi:glycosyltransferase family 2 protein [Flavobacterium psychrophilum]|uniref:glycosyltransferase family 2 protein n=1 Tax=Flavobacterium psychrophilum TaxID=96345 RepID=UPI0006187AFB|nr:glycosyltransferase family 2 protein [Flavobacterium psychrophilum]EKT4499528.1 glycosyltransferase family 2 protein [Flavobacterium psychrophilum]EKT4552667.1 glycosyltransferase family 2 protein [Flavobacterium psychrophilum]ELM3650521.1 glycosyltransferase family 2 protein [Flavobacterium psychrophilum]ELM3671929.1 glycosyltransferase family 2 protein [Flavobacterium psychrophilum]ELM3725893.1 glycosyltransferase family 2 protein [Flavobacterium psychrophilum]